MKKIMLSVLGLSPQVLTEALYALLMQGRLVHEIHVITTMTGRDLIHSGLLASGEGAFYQFLKEYQIPENTINFSPSNIHVLRHSNGEELYDIITPEDNEILVRKCMELSWRFTRDSEHEVYFMIAGGRKTMSACLALSAQFYGRPCDRIYHVLISPEFENCRDFYFPPRKPRLVATTDSKGKVCYRNTKDAEIWLVSMPFVSVRDKLTKEDLKLPQEPEILLASLIRDNPPRLQIDFDKQTVIYKGKQLDLSPLQMALLGFFAIKRVECSCNKKDCDKCFISVDEITEHSKNQELIAALYDKVRRGSIYPTSWSEDGKFKLDSSNFATYRSKLNKKLKKELGCYAEDIEITSIGPNNYKRYGMRLAPEWIAVQGFETKEYY